MKKINDEKLVKLVKSNTNYQVKTTSQSILNQYKYESSLESQTKPQKSHKKAIAFGSLFGAMAAACLIIGVSFAVVGNKNNSTVENSVFPNVDPQNNVVLKKQLITFSAFAGQINSDVTLRKQIRKANLVDEDKKLPTIDKVLIKDSIDMYEEVETSVNYLYHENSITTKTTEVKANFDNVEYSFVTKFYYDELKDPFAYYYFNEPSESKDDEEIERTSKAYYAYGKNGFNVDVHEEVEKESDEEEVETTLILRDVHKVDKHVYVVEKEVETEIEENIVSSENSLSIVTYENEEQYKEEEFIKKVSSETEVEGNENEIEVEIETAAKEVSYKITKVDDSKLNLLTTYEEKIDEERSFEDELVSLEYTETGRIYTWKDSIWTF